MSGVFMDGGNHDSVSHGIDHGGHDHGGHGVHHGHGQGGHSLIAQILGLDQSDHAHLAHHGGEGGEGLAPSQSASWNSALQGLKLENLMAGINITPNFLLLMLFASFVGWLGVVYWIRHHEPFANQVLGSSAAYAPTAADDRRLIGHAREAMPFKTVARSGMVYCPNPGQNNPPANGSPVNNSLSQAMSSAFGQGQAPSASSAQPMAMQSTTSSSPVNQSLSAAMSSAFASAPAASAPPAGMSAPMSEQFAAQSGGQMGAQMGAPMGAQMGSPMGAQMGSLMGSGSARLFSSRHGLNSESNMQQFGQQMGAMSGGSARLFSSRHGFNSERGIQQAGQMGAIGGGSARLFSSRGAMLAQAQAAPPVQAAPLMPAAPAVDPNVWSLANQGGNSFSSDTAQFNSQFGAPLTGQAQAPGH